MTALKRIREEQEKLAGPTTSPPNETEWKEMHRRWLKLQREALAIIRGELCEEHAFADCHICKQEAQPDPPLRPDVGDGPSLAKQMKDASKDPLPLSASAFPSVPERPPSFPPIETMSVSDGDTEDPAIEDGDPGDENDYRWTPAWRAQ